MVQYSPPSAALRAGGDGLRDFYASVPFALTLHTLISPQACRYGTFWGFFFITLAPQFFVFWAFSVVLAHLSTCTFHSYKADCRLSSPGPLTSYSQHRCTGACASRPQEPALTQQEETGAAPPLLSQACMAALPLPPPRRRRQTKAPIVHLSTHPSRDQRRRRGRRRPLASSLSVPSTLRGTLHGAGIARGRRTAPRHIEGK